MDDLEELNVRVEIVETTLIAVLAALEAAAPGSERNVLSALMSA